MAKYYIRIGTCIDCNAGLFRDSAEKRSRGRNKKTITMRIRILCRAFCYYHIILRHHHSLCSGCILLDVSQWITNIKDFSAEINRSISSPLSKKYKP